MDEREWAKELSKIVNSKKRFHVLTRYSKSGMTRYTDVYYIDDQSLVFLNFYFKKAGSRLKFNKDGSMVISGWGFSEIPVIVDEMKDILRKHKLKYPKECIQHRFNKVKLP